MTVYSTYALSIVVSKICSAVTWPRIINAFIQRYLNDVVFRETCARVATAKQRKKKTKGELNTALQLYAGLFSEVFNDHFLINYFLRGLLLTTTAIVDARVHRLPPRGCVNFSVLRNIAQAKDTTYRARADAQRPIAKKKPATKSSRLSSIGKVVGADQEAASRQNVVAIAAMSRKLMLTPPSTASFFMT